ncbi:MAG: DUF192 domain-containing protein [Minisyncoccota bacterium]
MIRSTKTGLIVSAIVAVLGGLFFYATYTSTTTPPPLPPGFVTATFGGVSLRIEFATTTATREKGLGGRTNVPEGYGMLFVFPKDSLYGFWMKNTLVPLDMFWLDDKGQVVFTARDVAPSTYPDVFYPTAPARYVLETAAGFARAHDIATGTPFLLKNFPIVSE